jgi:hypothetical protein
VNVFQPNDGVVAVATPAPDDEADGTAVPAAGDDPGADDAGSVDAGGVDAGGAGGVDAGGAGAAVELQDANISARHSPAPAVVTCLLRPILAPRTPAIRPYGYFPAGRSEVIIFRRSLYSAVSV